MRRFLTIMNDVGTIKFLLIVGGDADVGGGGFEISHVHLLTIGNLYL